MEGRKVVTGAGMPTRLRSSLFLKTFLTITAGVVVMCAIFYLTTVPMVNSMAYDMEERSGSTILANMRLLIEQAYRDLQSWERSALAGRKRELRHLIDLAVAHVRAVERAGRRAGLSDEEIRRRILEDLRGFRYGEQNDYVWAADYTSRLVSHPDPKLNGTDFSQKRDVKGRLIVPPMVKDAIARGEGFYSYWWRRLGAEEPIEKLSYYRNLPEWGWVIGTGVYVDDVRRDVEARKQGLIEDLRRVIHSTRFAGEGYLFIFDAGMHMIIHPNPNIEGTDFGDLLDPVTNRPIGQELIEAAASPEGVLRYRWDKPADPGRYIYGKIAWVRHVPGLDWYVALSAYTDDLERSAAALTRRIVLVSLVALLLAVLGGYLFVRAFTAPITRMARSAERIRSGDLTTTIELQRDDEIGLLARAFNDMVGQLRAQIGNLEQRVADRTRELSGHVRQLETQNRQIEMLNQMSDLLQACLSAEELYGVVVRTLQVLFPGAGGQILRLSRSDASLEVVSAWEGNDLQAAGAVFEPDDCWAVRRGKEHRVDPADQALVCAHAHPPDDGWMALCIPMSAQGETMGILHLRFPLQGEQAVDAETAARLLQTVAEQAALSLANLRLRKHLLEQSQRDALTGLFNRRHAMELLRREERRALRGDTPLGVMLLDVDHFKQVNDRWGHDAGDEVLRRLATVLQDSFREEDIVCRYGGEEFLVALPMADCKATRAKAEALRARVEAELRVPWHGGVIPVTISVGVACYPDGDVPLQAVITRADEALYAAKHAGRNRVCTHGEPVSGDGEAMQAVL